MEKYSRWRDLGTGIQPFLPPIPSRNRSNCVETLIKILGYLLKPILGIIRILIVSLVALIFFILADLVGLTLVKVKPINRIFHFGLSFILVRVALFLMGFYWIRTENVSLRRGRGNITKNRGSSASLQLNSGDLIVSNWTSYVDLLYLAFRYDPVFTQLYPTTNTLRPISLWTAIKLTGSYPDMEPPSDLTTYSLTQLVSFAKSNGWGPIVLFPEATTSNGRALLKFSDVFKEFSPPVQNVKILIMNMNYDYESFSPTYTAGNKLWHFVRLCSEFYNQLTVKYLVPEESLSSPSPSPSPYTLPKIPIEDPIGHQILNIMGQMTRLRKTSLGASEKREFLEYYSERTSRYINKKRR
ncbi:hypothetical protein G9A89_008813 [Geosiphon pyriformis]|nr:hypothetical protein G9A89_008813 [Geosiphon pyriformis]